MKFEQQSNFPRDVWPRPGASQAKCHLSELWQWSWIKTNQRVLTVTPPLGWLIQFGRRLIGAEDTSDRGGRTRAASSAVSPACFQASAAKLTWLAGASLYVLTVAQRCFVVKRGCGWGRGVTEEGREGKKKGHAWRLIIESSCHAEVTITSSLHLWRLAADLMWPDIRLSCPRRSFHLTRSPLHLVHLFR